MALSAHCVLRAFWRVSISRDIALMSFESSALIPSSIRSALAFPLSVSQWRLLLVVEVIGHIECEARGHTEQSHLLLLVPFRGAAREVGVVPHLDYVLLEVLMARRVAERLGEFVGENIDELLELEDVFVYL